MRWAGCGQVDFGSAFGDAFGSSSDPAAAAATAAEFADAWGTDAFGATPAFVPVRAPPPPPVSKSPAALAAEGAKPKPPPVGPSPAALAGSKTSGK